MKKHFFEISFLKKVKSNYFLFLRYGQLMILIYYKDNMI